MNRHSPVPSVKCWPRRCLIAAAAFSLLAAAPTPAAADDPYAPLLPKPAKFARTAGTFRLSPQTHLSAAPGTEAEAQYLIDLLAKPLGEKMTLTRTADAIEGINLLLDPNLTTLGTEGYTLDISPAAVKINAATATGVFYGIQTLREMLPVDIEKGVPLPAEQWAKGIPCCHVEDQPLYSWRGLMIDSARHFFPKSFILREIDLLALHKLNVLHLHLTDDQGWRIEIKKYPKLTEVGAWRRMLPTDTDWGGMTQNGQYGGFYTQDDIRQIVAYAASRHITVVPEIEMPGHSQAALAAYPELSCTGGPFAVATNWGVHADIYCAGKEKTFEFLQDVLDEVCDLFPGSYIHVGGDESPWDRWLACPDCRKRMADNKLPDCQALQSYFIKRIGTYLASKHRKLIGWNEILKGGLGDNAAVMSWQGMDGGKAAATQGHDVVMSPESNCYFDHASEATAARNAQGSVALSRAYGFVPTPPDLVADLRAHVLGAQGNLWAERIPTAAQSDYMAFPRACALAEALWTPGTRDYTEFAQRLAGHLQRLTALGVKYHDDPMIHAVEIGQWTPAQRARIDMELTWDITAQVKAGGQFTVRFEHATGRDTLRTHWVELQQDDKPLGRDTHEGTAGPGSRANTYQVAVTAPAANAKYTLHVSLQYAPETGARNPTDTGIDTRGQVFLIPQSAAP